jgi:hypothetical protein
MTRKGESLHPRVTLNMATPATSRIIKVMVKATIKLTVKAKAAPIAATRERKDGKIETLDSNSCMTCIDLSKQIINETLTNLTVRDTREISDRI